MNDSKDQKAAADPPLDCRAGLPEKLRAYVNDNGDWAAGLLPEDVLAAADEIERLRGALTELVVLKDMKDRGFGAHDTEGEDEYMRRKPLAWQAARDALGLVSCHQAALRCAAETPPPAGQKFAPGARVMIADNLGHHMSHFPAGKLATVLHTYAHAYGSTDQQSLRLYSLYVDDIGVVSWYDECQLSEAPTHI